MPVALSAIEGISHVRLVLPKELRSSDARKSIYRSILQVKKKFPDVPLLDPIENMNIKDTAFQKLVVVSKVYVVCVCVCVCLVTHWLCRKFQHSKRNFKHIPYMIHLSFLLFMTPIPPKWILSTNAKP